MNISTSNLCLTAFCSGNDGDRNKIFKILTIKFYSMFILYFLNSKEKFLTLLQLAKIVKIYLAKY